MRSIYLEVLERKPGALAGSTPLAQCRARGLWPASYDTLWAHWIERHGKQAGTRQMIGVLQPARTYGAVALRHAVEAALRLGCTDQAAVRAALVHYDRPPPSVAAYDTLSSPAVGR